MYNASAIKVLIASPGDVADFRAAARDVIQGWNTLHSEDRRQVLMPIGWETHSHPEMGDRPQAIVNKQLAASCDLLVAIFWSKLGSPTGTFPSGTVEEIEEHLNAGKPAMHYFSTAPPSNADARELERLTEFRESCKKRGLIKTFNSLPDFAAKFRDDLIRAVAAAYPVVAANVPLSPLPARPSVPADLGRLARSLLVEIASDVSGELMRLRTNQGLVVSANGKDFSQPGNPRGEAELKEAIAQLQQARLLDASSPNAEILHLTLAGYKAADIVRAETTS